jgi:hypothetical protein
MAAAAAAAAALAAVAAAAAIVAAAPPPAAASAGAATLAARAAADMGAALVLPMLRRCDYRGNFSILNVTKHTSKETDPPEVEPASKILRTITHHGVSRAQLALATASGMSKFY